LSAHTSFGNHRRAQRRSRGAAARLSNDRRRLLETCLQIHSHQMAVVKRRRQGFDTRLFHYRHREELLRELRPKQSQLSNLPAHLSGWIRRESKKICSASEARRRPRTPFARLQRGRERTFFASERFRNYAGRIVPSRVGAECFLDGNRRVAKALCREGKCSPLRVVRAIRSERGRNESILCFTGEAL